jgi:predicted nucleic acid-binding protein
MKAVFLDTVGILALLERSDQWHEAATRTWAMLNEASRPMRTTTLVLLECGNAVARKPYRRRVAEIWREFRADGTLITPLDADFDSAWEAYELGKAGQAGIVDQVSIAVMRRLGLAEVFSSDAHFRAAGFHTLFGTLCGEALNPLVDELSEVSEA